MTRTSTIMITVTITDTSTITSTSNSTSTITRTLTLTLTRTITLTLNSSITIPSTNTNAMMCVNVCHAAALADDRFVRRCGHRSEPDASVLKLFKRLSCHADSCARAKHRATGVVDASELPCERSGPLLAWRSLGPVHPRGPGGRSGDPELMRGLLLHPRRAGVIARCVAGGWSSYPDSM